MGQNSEVVLICKLFLGCEHSGWVKINIDGASNFPSEWAAAGCSIGNAVGAWFGVTMNIGMGSSM